MFNSYRWQNTKNRLGIIFKKSKDEMIISFKLPFDKELAEKVIENINRNLSFAICKNCTKLFIVNSPTHEICFRCRRKDRENPGPLEL